MKIMISTTDPFLASYAEVEESKGDISYHLSCSEQSGHEEILLLEEGMFKYYIPKDLLSSKEKIADFIKTHSSLFILPLENWNGHHFEVKNPKLIAHGGFGDIYQVASLVFDNMEFETDMILKAPNDKPKSGLVIDTEIEFIHKLHQKLTAEERGKFFPDVHTVTYSGRKGYLAERFDCNLEEYLSKNSVSIEDKISIAENLLEQAAIFSKNDVIYTDIKLENVFMKGTKPFFADFGNCFFVEDMKKIPSCGFTFTTWHTCTEEKGKLFKTWMNVDEPTLKTYADQHLSRSLGLLLCELFEGETVLSIFDEAYSIKALARYVKTRPSLKKLEESSPQLHSTIMGMLGLEKPEQQLMPQESFYRSKRFTPLASPQKDNLIPQSASAFMAM